VTVAIRDISVRKDAKNIWRRWRAGIAAARGGSGCDGGGESSRRNRAAECSAEKQFGYHVMNSSSEGKEHHPGRLRGTAGGRRASIREDALAQQIGTGIELNGRRKDGANFQSRSC